VLRQKSNILWISTRLAGRQIKRLENHTLEDKNYEINKWTNCIQDRVKRKKVAEKVKTFKQ
jgi:hypothetical protein